MLNDMNDYAMNFHDEMTWNDTQNDVKYGAMYEMRDVHEMRNARCTWYEYDACNVYNEMCEMQHEMT